MAVPTEFQSTHPRRVRQFTNSRLNRLRSFNPRTHVGCDIYFKIYLIYLLCFNPRTHVGCDLLSGSQTMHNNEFQSTHPRRVRLYLHPNLTVLVMFQSTHPRRVRRRRNTCLLICQMFQSTHPRRVRQTVFDMRVSNFLFQSTHPRRVRQ